MRKLIFTLLLVALCSCATLPDVLREAEYAEETLINGFRQFTKELETHYDTVLISGYKTLFEDPSLYASFLKRITSFTQEDKEEVFITCSYGQKPGFFKFADYEAGVVGPNGSETITLPQADDDCFNSVSVQYTKISDKSVELVLTPSDYRSGVTKCKEFYTVASTQNFHSVTLGKPNKPHKWTLKNLSSSQIQSIQTFGLRLFRTCDKFSNLLPDIAMTVALFAGGFGDNPDIPIFGSKPTWWQEFMNPIFIKQGNGYQWARREDTFIDLDETEVHPGDFLIITRMDGLDQIIQWGTGSRSGHSVTLLDIDGEMYAVESQDAWYWPKHNIQRNKWSDWKQYAKDAGFNVALLPLREEIRAKFNNTAALEWFKTVEGVPYGYHNFIFGWIDTTNANLPPVLDINFLFAVFSMIDKYIPAVTKSFVGEALNKRLNTTGLNLEQLYQVMYSRNQTVAEVFAMPEQDSWVYSDGPSMVCSSFVAAIWKAGGLYNGLTIQATEFTPRDVYQTNFFDLNYKKPEKCKDTTLPYCQIMGKFRMDVTSDGYSTINPYNHMFEKCPSIPPLYLRTPKC